MTYLDTHVAVFLAQGDLRGVPARARKLLAGPGLLVSPMAVVELGMLYEIGRLKQGSEAIVAFLQRHHGVEVCNLAFADVAREACRQTWTRDPFDRMIVAQSALRHAPLLTRDARVLEHHGLAIEA